MSTPYEMLRYATPPRMAVGTSGKEGYLRLGFELDNRGRSILRHWERRTPIIVQQELYFDRTWAELPCVYILSSAGANIEGDRYQHHFSVGENAYAHIATGAATKLSSMQNNYSSLHQTIRLEAGAYLEYLPEPTIPCRDTRYLADTEIIIDSSATLFYAESYLCGRKYYGEMFAYDILSLRTCVRRADGRELFCEKMIIEPKRQPINRIGFMGDFEIFASVLILTPPSAAKCIYTQIISTIEPSARLAVSVTHLPNECGLLCRVMGYNSGEVKQSLRRLCSLVREQIKQRPLLDDFPWR